MIKIELTDKINVELIQSIGGDHMVVAAAKVSTSGDEAVKFASSENIEGNAGLINYLMSHRHGTPFEHSSLTFFVRAPIFVWREWHRHRIGFCLAGDTEIWTESYSQNCGRTLRKRKIKELYENWANGVKDSKGRVRFLPSVRNQHLRVLNEDTGFFELGKIEDIIESGVKECLLIETEHKKGWSLRCSKDHQILTSEGWVKAGDLTGLEMIAVSGKKSIYEHRQIPPTLRTGIGVWTSMQRNSLILDNTKCYICGKLFHKNNLVLDHQIPVVENIKLSLDIENLKPACVSCHQEKTNKEQILSQRCNIAGVRFERLKRKPYLISTEMTYDISMKSPWHNFVANGIVVHNSYSEESARYKKLEPVFWIPTRNRPLLPVDNFKSARPKFKSCNKRQYDKFCNSLKKSYTASYKTYLELIDYGYGREVARSVLPVGIMSSCWVTCNPRSLMSFLSLRTHDENAKFISYPQAEIELPAKICENIFQIGWPLTHSSFVKNGRVAP